MTKLSSGPTLIADSERDRRQRQRRKSEAWDDYLRQRGSRYEQCRLGNYVAESQPQQDVVAKLTALDIVAEFGAGNGLLLFGPAGTGKDHLLTGMIHKLIGLWGESKCPIIRWTSGAKLFEEIRDSFDSKQSESSIVNRFTSCGLLILSDPCLSGQSLTEYQRSILFRIVDARYSNRRPTWVSVNANKRTDIEKMIGVATVDRLADQATALACNWPSWRVPVKHS